MVEKITNDLPKLKKDIAIIDLLMNFVKDSELKGKWVYTINLYQDLENNIRQYQIVEVNQTLINYIDNDNYMLNRMIGEFKEDIYPLFSANCLVLIEKLKYDELRSMSKEIDENLKIYSIKHYIDNIYAIDLIKFKKCATRLLEESIDENSKKLVNKVVDLYGLNKNIYIQIEQMFSKIIKTLENKDDYINEMHDFLLHAFVILAGDKNV